MNVFYDLEFIEHTQTKRFCGIPYGQTPPTIELISIGMVDDTGREYYAISNEFNIREAWERYDIKVEQMSGDARNIFPEGRKYKDYWLRENVLKPIYYDLMFDGPTRTDEYFTYKTMKRLIKKYGKSRKQIAEDIKEFVGSEETVSNWHEVIKTNPPKLYGYFSSFDHVCLAWLFGKMIDLPAGFPMYTIDLKQMLDEKQKIWIALTPSEMVEQYKRTGDIGRAYSVEVDLTLHPDYPKNPGEHNALQDAKFNKQLYEFLQTL